jgi:hypothetical protein
VFLQVFSGELKERENLEDVSVDRKIILNCFLNKWDGRVWTGLSWLSIGHVTCCCDDADKG